MVFLCWSYVWRMRNSSLFKHDEAFLEMKYLIKTHTSISKAPLTFLKLMKKTFHRIKCLIIKVNNSVYVAMVPDWPYLTSWNVQCTYVSPFWPFVHKYAKCKRKKKKKENGKVSVFKNIQTVWAKRKWYGKHDLDYGLETGLCRAVDRPVFATIFAPKRFK